MTYRQEKKISINSNSIFKIKKFLSINGFKKTHPQRRVNSIYFDTHSFSMHKQSEEGSLPRKKIRLRWYNDFDNSKIYLEKKISLFDKKFKSSDFIKKNDFYDLTKKGINQNFYGLCLPKVVTSYQRNYFQKSFFRVTIDTNICYKNYLSNIPFYDSSPIMEVKYSLDVPEKAYNNIFFFTETRFSKYSRAINAIYKK